MPNFLQKIIYNLSASVPLLIMSSAVWVIQNHTLKVPICMIIFAAIITILFFISFHKMKLDLPIINVTVTNVAPYDRWIITYIISYILPFSSLVLKEINFLIFIVVAGLIVILAPYINNAIPNPFLLFMKYHFYKIETGNGVSDYVLISKRKIRKSSDVKSVKRIFEYLLIEIKEERK